MVRPTCPSMPARVPLFTSPQAICYPHCFSTELDSAYCLSCGISFTDYISTPYQPPRLIRTQPRVYKKITSFYQPDTSL